MQNILKMYYNIDTVLSKAGYFHYQNQLYYLAEVKDIYRFLEVYRYYCYLLHALHCKGYHIVKNNNQDIYSNGYILIVYEHSSFSFPQYLQLSLQPIHFQNMQIKVIKEQWIHKIDCVRELVKNYAYSFKHDQDMISLIYYYCGIAENSINILNHILSIDSKASIALGLSLTQPIENYLYEILNPFYYTFSSRPRHLLCLLKSRFITVKDIQNMLESQYYDVIELLYLFARTLYPSFFFQQILTQKLTSQQIQSYYHHMAEEKSIYQEIMRIVSFYVALPKISWLNHKNMI